MQRQPNRIVLAGALGCVLAATIAATALACPFCTSTAQTFSEEISAMDVAVIAKLVTAPAISNKPGDEIPKATFEITQIIKGEGLVKPAERIETLYFGDGAPGKSFLVMAIGPPKLMWSTPLPLSDRAQTYLNAILKLPKEGPERLVFFQNYLEDEDELLARDSYDEFARAPYSQVKLIKDHLDHDRIVGWIKNQDVPASRRRLYLVMLGICGTEQDLPMLEEYLRSSDRKVRSGLDALIACYLTLKGESGLALVDELFLANQKADYADTYAAIMAIRFHGSEGGVIEKQTLLASLHHMLSRPELADLVIPDLARWEDWDAMDKLMDLYKSANEKNSWVRVPVINYLRGCPLPRAKELLKECEKIDPASVKRANSFFPTTPAAAVPEASKASQSDSPGKTSTGLVSTPAAGQQVAAVPAEAFTSQPTPPPEEELVALNVGAAPAAALKKTAAPAPNLWAILGVPWAVGLALVAVHWTLLHRGR